MTVPMSRMAPPRPLGTWRAIAALTAATAAAGRAAFLSEDHGSSRQRQYCNSHAHFHSCLVFLNKIALRGF